MNMRAISKVTLVETLLVLMMMPCFCAFAAETSADSDIMTKDAACDGIIADDYFGPEAMSGIVNLEGRGVNKINNDNGRITIVKEDGGHE